MLFRSADRRPPRIPRNKPSLIFDFLFALLVIVGLVAAALRLIGWVIDQL